MSSSLENDYNIDLNKKLVAPAPESLRLPHSTQEALRYLGESRTTDIVEALLCALAVSRPSNPLPFILEKLYHLKKAGVQNVTWCA